MIRGTAAQFRFDLPYKFCDLRQARIVFWQKNHKGDTEHPLPIVKELQHCTQADAECTLCVKLTPEETLRFSDQEKAYVQLKACPIDGLDFASYQEVVTVYPIYDDDILGDITEPIPDDDGWTYIDGGIV